jgi:hypothetical protein
VAALPAPAPAAATRNAPPSAPKVPNRETAPLVPDGTDFHVNRCRGGRRLQAPSEVAQVSAAAAARLAVTTQRARPGLPQARIAPSAAGPPLASTCQGSR